MHYFIRKRASWALIVLALGCSKSGQTSAPTVGKGPTGLPSVPGEPDTSVKTALPAVPSFAHVSATAVGDAVDITVEPVAGAKDYRVYVLPSDDDVKPGADGQVTVTNAIYRCAGDRQAVHLSADTEEKQKSEAIKSIVKDLPVEGYTRTEEEATLGYVYVTPGSGRVPVYALGDPGPDGDNLCFQQRWNSSRSKKYVTSEKERTDLLDQHWRDDGIAFYAPEAGADGTQPVYAATAGASKLLFVDGPESKKRDGASEVFNVLSAAPDPLTADVVPLTRVYYTQSCGTPHDVLAAGQAWFERVRYQGDQQPMFSMHWSGIKDQTTLVVEALDQGCPFTGVISPISRDAASEDKIDYPAYLTLEQTQAASATGEVFINGQHEAANHPRAIARTFVKVSPGPKPDMDWFAGFGPDETLPDFSAHPWDEPCLDPDGPTCNAQYRQTSDFGDLTFAGVTANRFGVAPVLGELWVTYADVGGDVGGKFRLTPNARATVSATSYLHVTMEVDAFSTGRRYPQLWISDAEPPIQPKVVNSNTVLIQVFRDDGTVNWPNVLEVEVCDHRVWDVNNQCPVSDLFRQSENGAVKGIMPIPELAELTGVDRSTRIDAFLSSKRVYLFADDQPYGCQDLPAAGVPTGKVTVTFGDVLYHSLADPVFSFHEKNQKTFTKRHFDNLGFKSGVEGPKWDEARYPCFAASAMHPF